MWATSFEQNCNEESQTITPWEPELVSGCPICDRCDSKCWGLQGELKG